MKNWALVLSLFASHANAGERTFWSEDAITNSAIIASNILLVVDWVQTRYIADNLNEDCGHEIITTVVNPNGPQPSASVYVSCQRIKYYESGLAKKFIGETPKTKDVNKYFVASIITTNAVGYFLPEKSTVFGFTFNPKKSFYIGYSAFEAYYVEKNYQLGIRGDFN